MRRMGGPSYVISVNLSLQPIKGLVTGIISQVYQLCKIGAQHVKDIRD